jgi:hypothetical protein
VKRAKPSVFVSSNLLIRVCADHWGEPIDFKLIKLLLNTGVNPNAVDNNRSTPHRLMALREFKFLVAFFWVVPEVFCNCSSILGWKRCHQDQVDASGQCPVAYGIEFLSTKVWVTWI